MAQDADTVGDTVLMLNTDLALSSGSTSVGSQCVLYGSNIGRGASSTSVGDDALLFAPGKAQTGAGQVQVGGQEVGFYESDFTHLDWYQTDRDGDSGSTPVNDSEGAYDVLVDDTATETLYVWVHYSTADQSYALGCYYAGSEIDQVASKLIIGGSAGVFLNPGNPVVQDDADDGGDTDFYGTESNGDSFGANRIGGGNGDGFMYQFPAGEYTFQFQYRQHPNFPSYDPVDQLEFKGPDGKTENPVSYGDDISIEISVPSQ